MGYYCKQIYVLKSVIGCLLIFRKEVEKIIMFKIITISSNKLECIYKQVILLVIIIIRIESLPAGNTAVNH